MGIAVDFRVHELEMKQGTFRQMESFAEREKRGFHRPVSLQMVEASWTPSQSWERGAGLDFRRLSSRGR